MAETVVTVLRQSEIGKVTISYNSTPFFSPSVSDLIDCFNHTDQTHFIVTSVDFGVLGQEDSAIVPFGTNSPVVTLSPWDMDLAATDIQKSLTTLFNQKFTLSFGFSAGDVRRQDSDLVSTKTSITMVAIAIIVVIIFIFSKEIVTA